MTLHPTTRPTRSGHGAACALTLALAVAVAALANLGLAVAGKALEAPAPAAVADPVARLLDTGEFDRAALAAHVPALAAIAADDDDARQELAIAALGIAGTSEAHAALAAIVENGSPVDAELALVALGSLPQPAVAP